MLRLMGLLLLFSSCALFGARKGAQLGERVQATGRMIDFWRQFALQLECLRCPPSQLVHLISGQQEFSRDPFFAMLERSFDVGGSFKPALDRALAASPQLVRWGIAQAILPLGDVIGVRELETQLSSIASSLLTLAKIEHIAETEQEQKGNLYRKLGILAGVLCVVVFL